MPGQAAVPGSFQQGVLRVSHPIVRVLRGIEYHKASRLKVKVRDAKEVPLAICSETIMPKLIDSEITRIDKKAKEIGTAYSLFLLQQRKFKVLSNESKYF